MFRRPPLACLQFTCYFGEQPFEICSIQSVSFPQAINPVQQTLFCTVGLRSMREI
jgi:hypothetical protein